MVSEQHLEFATTLQVVRAWGHACTQTYHTHEDFNMFMLSIGLQDESDPHDDSLGWKFRVVDAPRWTLACIRYGF